MARNYVISHHIYFLQENKRLQQIRREKSVVLQKKKRIALMEDTMKWGSKLDSIRSLSCDHVLYQATPWIFLGFFLVQMRGFISLIANWSAPG